MRMTRAVLILLLLVSLPALAGKPRRCQFRIHAEANPADGESFTSAVKAKVAGRDAAIEKMPRITENEVVAFLPYRNPDGNNGALFELDDHGRVGLDVLSVEKRGTYIFVFINGRIITEMKVDKRVQDGKIYVPSGLTDEDIKLMTKTWHLIKEPHH